MTINKKETVHVITSVERRRRWSIYEKKAIVEETYEQGKSVSYVARKHGIAASQVFLWRRKMEEGALVGVSCQENVIPETEYRQAIDRLKRLERLLGQKTEEVEILKDRS
jgi:transposase